MKRDQKLVGSDVIEAWPAGKPIQSCTQVAGVQRPVPGSDAATSIAMMAPAVAAVVPIVPRVTTAASRPMAANAASTSRARATCELAKLSAWAAGSCAAGR